MKSLPVNSEISSEVDFFVRGGAPILQAHMPKSVESVQEYIQRIAKEKGLNHKDIAARAKKKGYKLSEGYVSNVMYGVAGNPTISLAKALAAGLGEEEEDVFRVLRGEPVKDDSGFRKSVWHTLYEDSQDVPENESDLILSLVDNVRRAIRAAKRTGKR